MKLSVNTLKWAAEKSGNSLNDFAHILYARDETAKNIARGELTLPQIRKFAQHAGVPFGFLFLPNPPENFKVSTNLVDFRTTHNSQPLSEDFLDIYKDVEHKQSWYREYLISIDAPQLDFVGRFKDKFDEPVTVIADDIRNILKLDYIEKEIGSAEDYYHAFAQHCENAGILVFKNSVVVNNTKRKLNPEEFRGFVISDLYAPTIFINGQDTKYANIFTLAHELAHVWMGESGISDVDTNSNNAHEIKCNRIAAELLVPNIRFLKMWDSIDDAPRVKVAKLNSHFKVSELVIARVAYENNKIDRHLYQRINREVFERWREYKAKLSASEGGPTFAVMLPIKNSRLVTGTVLKLLKTHNIGPSEASILLNISPSKVAAL